MCEAFLTRARLPDPASVGEHAYRQLWRRDVSRAAADNLYARGRRCDTSRVALQDDLRAMLDSRTGRWGVYARHLDTGETLAIRADEETPAQSSLKVCVLLTYTKAIRIGKDDPARRVSLRAEDHELGSGILRHLSSGLSPTLNDLAWLMIVLSDNVATRALIREPAAHKPSKRRWMRSVCRIFDCVNRRTTTS